MKKFIIMILCLLIYSSIFAEEPRIIVDELSDKTDSAICIGGIKENL